MQEVNSLCTAYSRILYCGHSTRTIKPSSFVSVCRRRDVYKPVITAARDRADQSASSQNLPESRQSALCDGFLLSVGVIPSSITHWLRGEKPYGRSSAKRINRLIANAAALSLWHDPFDALVAALLHSCMIMARILWHCEDKECLTPLSP